MDNPNNNPTQSKTLKAIIANCLNYLKAQGLILENHLEKLENIKSKIQKLRDE